MPLRYPVHFLLLSCQYVNEVTNDIGSLTFLWLFLYIYGKRSANSDDGSRYVGFHFLKIAFQFSDCVFFQSAASQFPVEPFFSRRIIFHRLISIRLHVSMRFAVSLCASLEPQLLLCSKLRC